MQTEKEISPDNNDIGNLIKPYIKNWKWFVVSVILSITLAFLYIRYTVPQYAINAKIKILEDQNSSSELGAFTDLGILGGTGNNVLDEIETIKSRTNLIEVVKELGLNKRIIALGNIKNTELYDNPPFNINFLGPDSLVQKTDHEFYIRLISSTKFQFANVENEIFKEYSFGKAIPSPLGDLIITPNGSLDMESYSGRDYQVKVSPLATMAEYYQQNIVIKVTAEFSNIISITLNEPIKKRGKDVINTLINKYNQNAVDDKKAIADRTSNFINERIAEIYGDLSTVDQSAEEFKAGRGIADIASQTNVNLEIGAANQQELQEASVQLDIASSMKDFIDSQDGYELLPANVGLADQTIANTTARYNELALERKRLLESSNEKNPIIVNLDQQLDGLKRSMKSSLNSVTNNLSLQVNSLSNQLSSINSRIYSVPKNERALRDITRQQQTTESLYLYLLQKREESQITFASASPKSKVIDRAYLLSKFPVSPKKSIVFLAAIILGVLIPFSIIYIKDLLDNKIHNKLDLEKIAGDIPVIVEIPKLGKKDARLVKKEDRSVLAESLRILRTNLNYIQRSNKTVPNNIFFITSSVPGEGKTFTSSNLAAIYANTGKRVLLIGADIRNPKLYDFFSDDSTPIGPKTKPRRSTKAGLTEYIVDPSLNIQDITNSSQVNENSIDIIFSGKIPPNPTELLMSNRMEELFEKVSKLYDYVIVDTAPLMVVTDTVLISEYASQILYVVKAGATEKKVLEFPLKLKKEGKLKGLSFVVNNVKQSELGYGGKYGYGYGKTVKKWWKFS
ncbi:MAG: polysaccharide biosynthesis tyrosine autokinase [Muricauda sp.]|nr:tyrosine-protein kinase [Allomuricauda sp.]MBO6532635.1 polysaccharide biosynthesis tyrosine autokinase [Allomuricauda sp.]MBO6589822.1 polysaccharide biosynthesis tyrosine autokinase [Allomuricauda sp.]MBO6619245.1 polysaccharide biosynthesis tyrosine autokinase [Allomuricauda sp.]MBO6645156.1 polysaccharide biosynthesis tyrosine autokinase [Allomuricauda sp.]MBO6747568.1 polysaccharide biosynthesis tyrosine autokinase [Allomuricauda sp.]